MKKILKGFSLVELMVSLVVVAVLTAAFTPIITKKLRLNSIAVGMGNGSAAAEKAEEKKKCSLMHGNGCIECTQDVCNECEVGYTIDSGACTLCATHISGCFACSSKTNCTSCNAGYFKDSGSCSACEAGTYSKAGASSCISCEAQTYSAEGASSCTLCPDDMYSEARASSCISCSVTWNACKKCTKDGCTKCMDGCTLSDGSCTCPPPTLASKDSWFTKQSQIAKDDVVSIEFKNSYNPTGTEYYTWNASENDNIPANAYAIDNGSGKYRIIVNDNNSGLIYANANSSNTFKDFKYLESIAFNTQFNTSSVVNMSNMFANAGYNSTSFSINEWSLCFK